MNIQCATCLFADQCTSEDQCEDFYPYSGEPVEREYNESLDEEKYEYRRDFWKYMDEFYSK